MVLTPAEFDMVAAKLQLSAEPAEREMSADEAAKKLQVPVEQVIALMERERGDEERFRQQYLYPQKMSGPKAFLVAAAMMIGTWMIFVILMNSIDPKANVQVRPKGVDTPNPNGRMVEQKPRM
ncbi:MAG: hypothetical protein J0L72_02270 [Armatimonadetes bacterium]|nr:hypothetical protein [Armatimonadota bacterium]